MKKCLICLFVFLLLLTSCGKAPEPVPETPEIIIENETVYSVKNKRIESLSEKGEPLPSLYLQGEEKGFYYEEDLSESIRQHYRFMDYVDVEYQKGEYNGQVLNKVLSVELHVTEKPVDPPKLSSYDTSWKDDPVKYDGDFLYASSLPEGGYVKRTACKVFEEEFPKGVAGLWCKCAELDNDELYYYPIKDAAKGLEGEELIHADTVYREYGEVIPYENSYFYHYLTGNYQLTPVPDIYKGIGGETIEHLRADFEGGSLSLSTIEKENGVFLVVSVSVDNPDYDPSKGYSSPWFTYSSIAFVPIPDATTGCVLTHETIKTYEDILGYLTSIEKNDTGKYELKVETDDGVYTLYSDEIPSGVQTGDHVSANYRYAGEKAKGGDLESIANMNGYYEHPVSLRDLIEEAPETVKITVYCRSIYDYEKINASSKTFSTKEEIEKFLKLCEEMIYYEDGKDIPAAGQTPYELELTYKDKTALIKESGPVLELGGETYYAYDDSLSYLYEMMP